MQEAVPETWVEQVKRLWDIFFSYQQIPINQSVRDLSSIITSTQKVIMFFLNLFLIQVHQMAK